MYYSVHEQAVLARADVLVYIQPHQVRIRGHNVLPTQRQNSNSTSTIFISKFFQVYQRQTQSAVELTTEARVCSVATGSEKMRRYEKKNQLRAVGEEVKCSFLSCSVHQGVWPSGVHGGYNH
eukprot:GHVS01055457.1.p1 GENE.GHVS01055457.1~~GHVS01055457.1.p1  ORF type:complete len:122 (+),score=9.98 GHVS01055457.1:483-848(+)